MLYKDTLVDFLFPFFKNLNAAKGRTKLRFLRVSHLAQSSVTAALTRFDLIRQDECGLADFN
jgi:hypothetical protein